MTYDALAELAQSEFSDIVVRTEQLGRRASAPLKLRIHLRDNTLVDVWYNPDGTAYSYHWECRAVRGLLFRHDNAPDHPQISTHPRHFHNGSEAAVEPSFLPSEPASALREFLSFARLKLAELGV